MTVPNSARPEKDGLYLFECLPLTGKEINDWALSPRQARIVNNLASLNSKAVILLSPHGATSSETLAHEIGHHLFAVGFSYEERCADTPSEALRKQSGLELEYFLKSRDEIHAELMSFYLTGNAMNRGQLRICEALLDRVQRHNPKAANLIEQHRLTTMRQMSQSGNEGLTNAA
jgi:hypothetical protein